MATYPINDSTTAPDSPGVVVYPDSDGKPMGETGIHVKTILHLYGALLIFFATRERSDAYVAADMFLYYQEGNPRAVKTPDVMVIFGVEGNQIRERRSFMTWREGAVPSVIFEITSKSTWMEDLVTKSTLYASLGVKEYFIFDPLEEYLEETLQGFELQDREFVSKQPVEPGVFVSEQLKLNMRREGIYLRLFDPETGEKMLSYDESLLKMLEETERAEQESQRAEQESQRAEQESQRAEQESQRAEAAEAENARLRTLLEELQRKNQE
jgi:Uma2 family endonuclease